MSGAATSSSPKADTLGQVVRPRPSGRRQVLLVGAGAVAVLVLVTTTLVLTSRSPPDVNGTPDRVSPDTSAADASVVPAAPPAGLKAPIVGLLDRQGEPAPEYGLAGWVVKTSWAELQPTPGGPIVSPNAIDAAVARAGALGKVLKLRIYAGTQAPEWAKHLGGQPVALVDPGDGGTNTVGRFWSDAFGQAYAEFQSKLASRYDGVPEIRETVMSRCTTIFAEPFIRQSSADENLSAFRSAGLNDDMDLRCFKEQVDAHEVWKLTRSDLAVNPYQSVQAKSEAKASPGGRARGGDLRVPEQVMQYCRQRLGVRCILENNSLRANPSDQYVQLYEKMEGLGRPLAFQTATGDKVGDLAATVAMAADLGAASVELPISYRRIPARDLSQALAPAVARLSP